VQIVLRRAQIVENKIQRKGMAEIFKSLDEAIDPFPQQYEAAIESDARSL
jgi:hypothetical protein